MKLLCQFFVVFTALMCSDSIFNLLKRVADGSFLFLCKTLVFLFLPFLNLGVQIRSPQNRYTDLKSALDQPHSSYCFSVDGFPIYMIASPLYINFSFKTKKSLPLLVVFLSLSNNVTAYCLGQISDFDAKQFKDIVRSFGMFH